MKAISIIVRSKLLWGGMMLLLLSFVDGKKANIQVGNIAEGYADSFIYNSERINDKVYINAIDSKEQLLFRYNVTKAPMEIRPLNAQHLLIAGGIKPYYFFVLDEKLNIVDTIYLRNEKGEKERLDLHDFQYLPNGNKLVFNTENEEIDVKYLEINNKNKTIVVQHYRIMELDATHNTVLNDWYSKDHFAIEDAGKGVNRSLPQIDYCHINSIQYISEDKTVLISSRNMDEITKIKWPEGQILWRLGGLCNEFHFKNDSLGFNVQHQARLHDDRLILFDNGAYHTLPRSSVVIYQIDEKQKEATLLHRLYGDKFNFSERRGGVTLLENGNFLVCWAKNKHYQYSEITFKGNTLQKGYFDAPINYRINKGTWLPALLEISTKESVNEKPKHLTLQNNSNYTLNIEKIDGAEAVKEQLPKILEPQQNIKLILEQPSFTVSYTEKEGQFFVQQLLKSQ